MIEYILLGFIFPILLNLVHLVLGIHVVVARGSVVSLGFTGISFLTKTVCLLWVTWFGVSYLHLDFRIFVPMLTFFWFFSHLAEAFVIQHYIEKNVPEWLQRLQIK